MGHCDLHIMVQRFCLVSLTISNRKTSYRSLKQTGGSTNCPWTNILVVSVHKSGTIRNILMILGKILEQVSMECCIQDCQHCSSSFSNLVP